MSTRPRLAARNALIAAIVALLAPFVTGAPAVAAPLAGGYSARALAARAESELTTGHPGAARLDWERARLLAPRSPAVAAGLAKARAAAGIVEERPPLWRRLVERLSSDEWAWIGVAGLACAAAALVAFGWSVLGLATRWSLLAGGAALAALGFLAAARVAPRADQAIVVAPDLVARIAPFAQADPAFAAPEGSVVRVRGRHGEYTLVAGSAGEGWLPSSGVETVLPGERRH
jgi:hypothetical protein